jgi:hypothetical protein
MYMYVCIYVCMYVHSPAVSSVPDFMQSAAVDRRKGSKVRYFCTTVPPGTSAKAVCSRLS